MKAVYINSFDITTDLTIVDIESPVLTSKDIRIEVKASGLNRSDLLQRRGLYPPPKKYNENIPGLECSGEVTEVGKDVTMFEAGDRVMALLVGMGQASEVVVHEDFVMHIPKHMSYEEASAIPEVFLTAYDSLVNQAGFALGESILVHAVGSGVGSAAVQLASIAGARKIYGTISTEKLEIAKKLNIDVLIDYKMEDFSEIICKGHNDRIDVIFDFVGGSYWDKNVKCLDTHGRMVLIGILGGNKFPETSRIDTILFKRIKVIGTILRSRTDWEKAELVSRFSKNILPFFESNKITPIVDTVLPASEVNQAYQMLEQNKNFGKIILTW